MLLKMERMHVFLDDFSTSLLVHHFMFTSGAREAATGSTPSKVLKNLAIFTGKQLCWSLIFNKVEIKKETLLKKRLQDRCFPVNIAKFLKTSIFKNICKRLLQGWNQMENILY